MAEAAINLTAGQKADRKLDMIFVDVGGSGTETWNCWAAALRTQAWNTTTTPTP